MTLLIVASAILASLSCVSCVLIPAADTKMGYQPIPNLFFESEERFFLPQIFKSNFTQTSSTTPSAEPPIEEREPQGFSQRPPGPPRPDPPPRPQGVNPSQSQQQQQPGQRPTQQGPPPSGPRPLQQGPPPSGPRPLQQGPPPSGPRPLQQGPPPMPALASTTPTPTPTPTPSSTISI